MKIEPTQINLEPEKDARSFLDLFETVTTVPSGRPRSFIDQIKIYDFGGVRRLYWYDATNDQWRYAGTVAGSDTEIQYNDNGAFGSNANFTFTLDGGDGNSQIVLNGSLNLGSISGNQGMKAVNAIDSDNAQNVVITGANGGPSGGTGGTITVTSGNGLSNARGGDAFFYAGDGNGTGRGGHAELIAGAGGASGAGGYALIEAGEGQGSQDAGHVYLTAGDATGTGRDGSVIINRSRVPSSSSDVGTAGAIAWDSSYIYICTATNTWKRVAIAW